jgi:hypothetical protein
MKRSRNAARSSFGPRGIFLLYEPARRAPKSPFLITDCLPIQKIKLRYCEKSHKPLISLARRKGFEPLTPRFEV